MMNGTGTAARDAAETADGLAALTRWSSALAWADIPETAQHRTATILCDDLAAIVAARDEPELGRMIDQLALSSGPAEATIFDGTGRRFDRYTAALGNGAASDWCELDSGYRRAVCHGGIYCVPALLAEGEAEGASLEDMLRALVIGFETISRVARTFTFDNLVHHPHGSLAAVGAAATVAALRRYSHELALAAITTAATMVVPAPFNHAVEGALIRNVWPGVGASTGIRAADWVQAGITGRPEGLHDVYAVALGAKAAPRELSEGLGVSWAVEDSYHKLHACCQYSHAAVEATLDILDALPAGVSPDNIQRIRIDTHWRGQLLDKQHPPTTLAAKFSLQHVLATTARHGHANADAFHADTLEDPSIAALREKVEIGAFEDVPEWPNDRPARVTWEMADGGRFERQVLSARGGPDRPFSDDEIRGKINGIVTAPYPDLPATMDQMRALAPDPLAKCWRDTVASLPPRKELTEQPHEW
jgi:2-methylcitrate dehydratase PrpD